MSELFDEARCLIEPTGHDWFGDGMLYQPVTIELTSSQHADSVGELSLGPTAARELAFSLLALAEHAERMTR